MSEVACPYWPELHSPETTFCPNTGRRMLAVAAEGLDVQGVRAGVDRLRLA